MTTEIQKIDNAIERGIAAQTLAGRMERTLALAGAVREIREQLTPEVMQSVMTLQGNALGFRTDKPYSVDVVRDCLIEACLHGLHAVGNEWNIIGGRCYITKEGMGHKLAMIPGLWYSITPGVPRNADGGAVVPMAIEWKYNGADGKRTIEICTKLNAGMGSDAVIGKATRKARAWLYQHVSGQELPEGDASEKDVTPVEVKRDLLKTKKAEATAPAVVEVEPATDDFDWRKAGPDVVLSKTDEMAAQIGMDKVEAWAYAKHGKQWGQLPVAMKRAMGQDWSRFIMEVNNAG